MISHWSQMLNFPNMENHLEAHVKSELMYFRKISLDLILNIVEVSIMLEFIKIGFH